MDNFSHIKDRNDLADLLGIRINDLTYILYKKGTESYYITFEIPKKNGDIRQINAPAGPLKTIQVLLADKFYRHIYKDKTQDRVPQAFIKNRSFITNAEIHRNRKYVFNVDLEDYFDSFHFGRVRGYFNKNKRFLFPLEIATILAQIFCYKGKLPQGAPSSPIISNLICEILDNKIKKLSKKYKLSYTRYADDLTFSTNDGNFFELKDIFLKQLSDEIHSAGFTVNESKTRFQLSHSRQEVTGLVVNKKVNVPREYYKETRAMAHTLYKSGKFRIDNEIGTINQLESRFSFINQLTWYNNKQNKNSKQLHFKNLSTREKDYQKFLFYKYFFDNSKPIIITEGKTDVIYLKAALKNLYKEYPELVSRNEKGNFEYKITFLNKTKRLSYFLGIYQDGGVGLNNIFDLYDNKKGLNYFENFRNISGRVPKNPVILLFDNEIVKGNNKPIGKFLNHSRIEEKGKELLKKYHSLKVMGNLFLLTVPLVDNKSECEIEDLFGQDVLNIELDGKKFSRKDNFNIQQYYGKEIFSKYILNHYQDINFNNFRMVLNNLSSILTKDFQ